jgi:hypothetical protein
VTAAVCPECVCGLLRGEDYDDAAALHRGVLLELGDVGELFRESLDELEAFIDVGVLAAAEDDGKDYFVLVGQELLGAVDLGHQVMIADFRAQPQFFVLAVMRVAFVLPLLLLVLEFAVIHDPANRRLFLRGNLHEVQADFTGSLQSFDGFDDAQQGTVLSDDTNRRDADLLVDPLAFLSEGDGRISRVMVR